MSKVSIVTTKRSFASTQKRKKESVNKELCDRFYQIYLQSGMKPLDFIDKINVASFSYVTEIKNYVLEPSKNMIITVCTLFNVSSEWLLFGYGSQFRTNTTKIDEKELMLFNCKLMVGYLEKEIAKGKKK